MGRMMIVGCYETSKEGCQVILNLGGAACDRETFYVMWGIYTLPQPHGSLAFKAITVLSIRSQPRQFIYVQLLLENQPFAPFRYSRTYHEAAASSPAADCLDGFTSTLTNRCRTHIELGGFSINIEILVQLQTSCQCSLLISNGKATRHPRFPNYSHVTR